METCKFNGCDKKAVNRGYCNKHYCQLWKQGLIQLKKRRKRSCRVPGCSNKNIEASGYCTKHYKQVFRYGVIFQTRFEPNTFIDYEDLIGIIILDKKGNFKAESFVDKEDDWVKNYKWHLSGPKEPSYLTTFIDGKQTCFHRILYPDSEQVDHKDRDKLNNKRSNLRPCTSAQNSWNMSKMGHNTSGVTGVHFNKRRNRWLAVIEVNGRKKCVGAFKSSEFDKAVQARKRAERQYFKEFSPTGRNI